MQKLNDIMISLQRVNTSEVMLAVCPSVSLYSAATLVADNLREQIRGEKNRTTRRYETCQLSEMAGPLCEMQGQVGANIYLHLSPLGSLFSFKH